jgi:hypothetical protein
MKAIKRLLRVAAVLLVVCGIGFWARPVSYFNEVMYAREWFSDMESRSVQVAGHRVHYLAKGAGGEHGFFADRADGSKHGCQ